MSNASDTKTQLEGTDSGVLAFSHRTPGSILDTGSTIKDELLKSQNRTGNRSCLVSFAGSASCKAFLKGHK